MWRDVLYPVQRKVVETPAIIRVVVAGRGGGKTAMTTWWAGDGMARGQPVLYVAPTAAQYAGAERHLRSLFDPKISDRVIVKPKRKDLLFVDRWTGGYVELRSGKLPANLRSGGYRKFVLDEADYLSERVADTVYGALARANDVAEVMVPTTPMDLPQASWVERDYQRGVRGDRGFASFRWTAWDVPHTSKSGLAFMRGGDQDDLESRAWCGGDPDRGWQAGGVPQDVYEREVLAHYVTARGVQLQRSWVEAAREAGAAEWKNVATSEGRANPRLAVAIGVDSAYSSSGKSDRTVGAVVARDRAGNLWILDAIEGRGGLDVHVDIVLRLVMRWVPGFGMMESRGDEDLAVQAVQREVDRELRKRGSLLHLPLAPRRPKEDKQARFAEVERSFRSGACRIHPQCPGWLLEELLAFPAKGHHDDGVDAVSVATLSCPYAPPADDAPYADPYLMAAVARSMERDRESVGTSLSWDVL